jgi:PAS domain-containing protein
LLLRATQRLTHVGSWEWDVAKQTMFWTEETYRLHDFGPGEPVPGILEPGARCLECYLPEDRPVILAAFQRCIEEGQPYDLEFRFHTAKGRQLRIRTLAEPVLENRKVVRVVGVVMDITDHQPQDRTRQGAEESPPGNDGGPQ